MVLHRSSNRAVLQRSVRYPFRIPNRRRVRRSASRLGRGASLSAVSCRDVLSCAPEQHARVRVWHAPTGRPVRLLTLRYGVLSCNASKLKPQVIGLLAHNMSVTAPGSTLHETTLQIVTNLLMVMAQARVLERVSLASGQNVLEVGNEKHHRRPHSLATPPSRRPCSLLSLHPRSRGRPHSLALPSQPSSFPSPSLRPWSCAFLPSFVCVPIVPRPLLATRRSFRDDPSEEAEDG